MIFRLLIGLSGSLFWFSPQAFATQQEGPAECLLISDIHFNPFLNPELFVALATSPASEWAQLFESSLSGGVSQYGSDSNYPLLKSSLDAAAKTSPHPEFILYLGDILAHNWRSQYEKLAPARPGSIATPCPRTAAQFSIPLWRSSRSVSAPTLSRRSQAGGSHKAAGIGLAR